MIAPALFVVPFRAK